MVLIMASPALPTKSVFPQNLGPVNMGGITLLNIVYDIILFL